MKITRRGLQRLIREELSRSTLPEELEVLLHSAINALFERVSEDAETATALGLDPHYIDRRDFIGALAEPMGLQMVRDEVRAAHEPEYGPSLKEMRYFNNMTDQELALHVGAAYGKY